MPFSDIMKEIVNGTEGAVGALIVGLDGIPVEEYSINKEMDIQSMTVEYSALLKEIEKGSQSAQIGSTREVTVIADKAMIMLRRLNDEYFIVLIINPKVTSAKEDFFFVCPPPSCSRNFRKDFILLFGQYLKLPQAVFYFSWGVHEDLVY